MSRIRGNIILEKIKDAVDFPELTRCCFCLPLTKGVTASAYINLIIKALILSYFSYEMGTIRAQLLESDKCQEYGYQIFDDKMHVVCIKDNGRILFQYKCTIIILTALCLDISFIIAFIAALYKKYIPLLKVYFYYALLSSVIFLICEMVAIIVFLIAGPRMPPFFISLILIVILIAVLLCQIFVQIYTQVLIWNTILKAEYRSKTTNSYQNHDVFQNHDELILNTD